MSVLNRIRTQEGSEVMKPHRHLPRDLATRYPLKVYDLFISLIAICAIALIIWQWFFSPEGEIRKLLILIDYFFCFFFFVDYIRCIFHAERKWHYIFTWGLLDLASSIPAIPALRVLRLAQIVRVLVVIRSVRILAKVAIKDSVASTVTVSTLVGCLLIVGACIGVLHFEQTAAGANIKTAEEVAWWAVETTSTVGYGDLYPITTGGRLFAILIMCVGIGLFATFAGALASTIMRHVKADVPEKPASEFSRLMEQNQQILAKLENLESRLEKRENL